MTYIRSPVSSRAQGSVSNYKTVRYAPVRNCRHGTNRVRDAYKETLLVKDFDASHTNVVVVAPGCKKMKRVVLLTDQVLKFLLDYLLMTMLVLKIHLHY